MALDPPITPDEEDIIRRIRTLQAKQAELDAAQASRVAAREQVIAERANEENLRRDFAREMRDQGITDSDSLLRRRD